MKRFGYGVAIAAAAAFALAAAAGTAVWADSDHAKPKTERAAKRPHKPADVGLDIPRMDSKRGMRLFAAKGCVMCHAVNGVGGHDAKNLDAHTMKKRMNPFEFTAKMWRMAAPMIAAQEEVLGRQILFTGREIGDIIAFVHDDAQQHKFTEAMIPPNIKKMIGHVHGAKPAHKKELGHDRMMRQHHR